MDQRTSLAVETLLSLGQEWTPPSPATSNDFSEQQSPSSETAIGDEEECQLPSPREEIKKVCLQFTIIVQAGHSPETPTLYLIIFIIIQFFYS